MKQIDTTERRLVSFAHRHRIARWAAVLSVATALAPATALADGQAAAASLFANLSRAGTDIGVTSADAVLGPPLVPGIYTLHNRQGSFMAYINESGTLFGDSRGFFVVSPAGAPVRKMSTNESAEMRGEVLNNIEYNKLVRVSSGDGGGRRLLLFSAVDCPSCKIFEGAMQQMMRKTSSTIYVVPSSLQRLKDSPAAWDSVVRLWCADNNGRAWQTYWQTRALPPARQCGITPQSAESTSGDLQSILMALEIPIRGVPAMLREDGLIMGNPSGYDAGFAALMSRAGQPNGLETKGKWLVAGTQIDDKSYSYDTGSRYQQVQAQPQGQVQQPGKIKASDLLKKLFK